MDTTIEIKKNIQLPVDGDTWKAQLDKLEQREGDSIDGFIIPVSKRSSVASIMSNVFHADPENIKVFKISVKGQIKGEALVYRDYDKEDESNKSKT